MNCETENFKKLLKNYSIDLGFIAGIGLSWESIAEDFFKGYLADLANGWLSLPNLYPLIINMSFCTQKICLPT